MNVLVMADEKGLMVSSSLIGPPSFKVGPIPFTNTLPTTGQTNQKQDYDAFNGHLAFPAIELYVPELILTKDKEIAAKRTGRNQSLIHIHSDMATPTNESAVP